MAEYYAKQEILTGKTMSPEVKLKKYQAVTEKEVQNLAKELFVKEKLNLALIGPFKSDKKFYKQIKL